MADIGEVTHHVGVQPQAVPARALQDRHDVDHAQSAPVHHQLGDVCLEAVRVDRRVGDLFIDPDVRSVFSYVFSNCYSNFWLIFGKL